MGITYLQKDVLKHSLRHLVTAFCSWRDSAAQMWHASHCRTCSIGFGGGLATWRFWRVINTELRLDHLCMFRRLNSS